MSEPNYNETVVIPLLQNKYRQLTQENLVLEANLLIERERNSYLSSQLTELQGKIESSSKRKKKEDTTLDGEVF